MPDKTSDKNQISKELLQRAYDLKGPEDTRQLYHDWAATYNDTMVTGLTYSAPTSVANMLEAHCDDKSALIADIGCGTGLTGKAAFDLGYQRLVGLDFCDEMLAQAGQLGIYQQLINADLTKTLDIETGCFDAAISSGIFTYGHLNADCLAEIFRIIRPGGLFVCVVRLQVWQELGFAETFARMQADKLITLVAEKMAGNYETSTQPDGHYLVFRKN